MEVQVATLEDFENWLILAREVEPLFGPMVNDPSFHEALKRAMGEKRTFCIRKENDQPGSPLCGAIWISVHRNAIGWFAVAERYRGQGYGKALLDYAIWQLDSSRDISVVTFDHTVPGGLPARQLYQRFGFRDHQPNKANPADVPTVVMVRPGSASRTDGL